MSQMQFSAVKFKIAPLQSAFIITLSAALLFSFFPHFFGAGVLTQLGFLKPYPFIQFEHFFFFLFSLLRHSELSLLCALLRGMLTSLWKYFILLYRDTWKEQLQNRIDLFPYMRGTHNP